MIRGTARDTRLGLAARRQWQVSAGGGMNRAGGEWKAATADPVNALRSE